MGVSGTALVDASLAPRGALLLGDVIWLSVQAADHVGLGVGISHAHQLLLLALQPRALWGASGIIQLWRVCGGEGNA